jgi:capsular exopolysaccharide synthesis family protein
MMLLGIAVVTFVVAAILISVMTPQYSAMAKVRLDPKNPLASNAQQARADLSVEAIDTELTAVRSLEVARAIVKAQGLVDDPEFSGVLNTTTNTPLSSSEVRQTVVANSLLQRLSVSREKLTYVLNVSFQSNDPIKAARLANAFANGYVEFRASKRMGSARAQSAWFQQRLDEIGREASVAEAQAAKYRARAGIVESGTGGTITDQQVAPLSGTLASAESDAAAAQAGLTAARSQMAGGGLDSVSDVLRSPVVTDLRRQRADALRTKNEIEARYGERHPESIRVRGQLATLDAQIAAEGRRVVGSLQATAASTKARVDSLRGSLQQLEHERERSVEAGSAAEALDREAAAKRALFDKMSQMSLENIQSSGSQIAVAEVIPSTPPSKPSSPNKPLLYSLALLVALAAGGGTITAQEVLSGGFRTVEDLEAQLGLPVLAVVPKVAKKESPTELMLERPTSMFAESFRIARTAILGARGEAGVKVIAITSSLPAEGKTTSAIAFARTLAIANARVLLLECDVRRAAVRQLVRTSAPKAGLVELLHGEISLDEAIQSGDVPNLDQVLVVSPYFSGENLFGEGRMEQLLNAVRERYDYIVLDLPPLMGLADGRYLAVLADAIALVVKWNSTPVAAATSALNWLRSDGSNPVGIIYTQVDPSAQSVGGLYYYSKKYSDYYQTK